MQAVVLFLNDRTDDPTKRLKLAGVRRYAAICGRVCVDNAAVARAAFRELSSGNPEAFAVVTEATSHEWSAVRVRTFRAEAANTGHSCPVYREIRCSLRLLPARLAKAQCPAVTRRKLFAEKVQLYDGGRGRMIGVTVRFAPVSGSAGRNRDGTKRRHS